MTDPLQQQIIETIQEILRNSGAPPDMVLTADDSMETVPAWDSLTFMNVFLAINETFGVNPDFDDAIHYTSVTSLCAYLKGHVG